MAEQPPKQNELLAKTSRYARIAHRCNVCKGIVPIGARYTEFLWRLGKGGYVRLKVCGKCEKYFKTKPLEPESTENTLKN